MYINPFVAGIVVTVVSEITLAFAACIIVYVRSVKKR